MIVATDNNWAIGANNRLLTYELKSDLQRFKQLTQGNIVVMGRKTLESLPNGSPLPDRTNIVITKDHGFQKEGVIAVKSIKMLKAELFLLEALNGVEVFIIGGESIYNQFLNDVSVIYVTKINHKFEQADTHFPNLDKLKEWKITETSEMHNEGGLEYQFVKYERIEETQTA